MPIHSYGVLYGRIIERRLCLGPNQHFQIRLRDTQQDYRVAVNVKSDHKPSELLYIVIDDFQHALTDELAKLTPGFTRVVWPGQSFALDYIRENLFHPLHMQALPHDIPGPDNDLNELLDRHVRKAMLSGDARLYAFGEYFGPGREADRYFGFRPERGIHNVHMNQGNHRRWQQDDGVRQDGGLIFYYPGQKRYTAIFLAFQSQSFHTNDETGRRFAHAGTGEAAPDTVRIVAALVNPVGIDDGKENVSLLNTGSAAIDLGGWSICDINKRRHFIHNSTLAAGQFLTIPLPGDTVQLANRGGIITLLDAAGRKVHGVSYTAADAEEAGRTIAF